METGDCQRHNISAGAIKLADRHLTEEQMLQCFSQYIQIVHPSMYMIDVDNWISKAKSVFRAIAYGQPIGLNALELSMVYIIVALGLSCSSSARSTFSGYSTFEWTIEYMRKSRSMLPDLLEQPPSILLAQYVVLLAMCKLIIRQTRSCYVYCGILGRILNDLNLRSLDFTDPRHFEAQRTCLSATLVEQYGATILGRPASYLLELPSPHPEAFPLGPQSFIYDFMISNLQFNRLASTCLVDMMGQSISSVEDLAALLDKCKRANMESVDMLRRCGVNPDFASQSAASPTQESTAKILLLLTKGTTQLCLLRPFLLLGIALSEKMWTTNAADPLVAVVEDGCNMCVHEGLFIMEALGAAPIDKFGVDFVVDYHFIRPMILLLCYRMSLATRMQFSHSDRLQREFNEIGAAVSLAFDRLSENADEHESVWIGALIALSHEPQLAADPMIRRCFAYSFIPELASSNESLFADSLSSQDEIFEYWKRCVDGTLILH